MPKTKLQTIFFTCIIALMMSYCMTLYNIVISTGEFTNLTFLEVFKDMWVGFFLMFLCAYFLSSHLAKICAFRVVQPGDRPIFIILTIQIFTVIFQVAFASIFGTFKGYGLTVNFIPDYIITYCKNFIFALPLQLILVGPLARFIFRSIFIKNTEKNKTSCDIQNDNQTILKEAI